MNIYRFTRLLAVVILFTSLTPFPVCAQVTSPRCEADIINLSLRSDPPGTTQPCPAVIRFRGATESDNGGQLGDISLRWSIEPLARQGTSGGGGTGGSGFFSIGGRAGVAIPHGTFNNFFDTSIAATVDLEYHATNQFSVAGLLGYRRFSGPFSSHLNLYQVSAGPKFYFTTGSTRPFVNGGVGAFVFESSTTKFGIHTGGGLQFRVWPKVWFEAEYNFHNVFTSGSNFRYSTVQGGARFRF